jgi:propanediol dehydratase small subunit
MEHRDIFLAGLAVAVALIGGAVSSAQLNRRLNAYWSRACAGRAWKRAFPSAGKREIRRFLRVFVDAFGFPQSRILKFLPDDRVFAIYRTIYPSKSTPDALEVETFAGDLSNTYRLDLASMWREDLTLGEIFSKTVAPRA